MKVAIIALAVLVATGCMEGTSTMPRRVEDPGARSTSLEISISLGTKDTPTRFWTLRCPGGGTLPQPGRACERLDAVDKPFAPVPKDVACTEIYGGPEVAEIRGTFQGDSVDARFTRTDGCEINRWNRVRFLFPGVS